MHVWRVSQRGCVRLWVTSKGSDRKQTDRQGSYSATARLSTKRVVEGSRKEEDVEEVKV
jgi:hypothetical protein